MATTTNINFAIDSTLITEAVQALCAQGGYQALIPDPANPGQTIPNPQTRPQFAKQVIRDFIRNAVLEQRNRAAQQATVAPDPTDRKSTRLNSSHANISYAVFC